MALYTINENEADSLCGLLNRQGLVRREITRSGDFCRWADEICEMSYGVSGNLLFSGSIPEKVRAYAERMGFKMDYYWD
tara:strand:+ start:1432 stop:1668 length:237 start_codon:yes stop_codon:yes gene_type:complete